MIKNAVSVSDLICKYENATILNSISFTVPYGSTCAVIGPSGCGKTTLLHAMAGFVRPISGEIRVNNQSIAGFPDDVSMVFQEYALLPWNTVFDNVALGLKLRHFSSFEIQEKTQDVLESLGISAIADYYPSQISGGQKQRTAIARSLVLQPAVLLLDEATSALDAMTREQLQNLLLSIHQKEKTTMVQVTHSIEEAVFLGQQILVLQKGSVFESIQNPIAGAENCRKQRVFYDMCLKVRDSLERGSRHEL